MLPSGSHIAISIWPAPPHRFTLVTYLQDPEKVHSFPGRSSLTAVCQYPRRIANAKKLYERWVGSLQ
jgi:hypothetical protein